MKKEVLNPKNVGIYKTDCCKSSFKYVPACFGDNQINICDKCGSMASISLLPEYIEVSKGTYRKIKY